MKDTSLISKNQQIPVAFLSIGSKQWWGGITYIHNLLFAISKLDNKKIQPIVFSGERIDDKILAMYKPFADIIQSSTFDHGTINWFLNRVMIRILRRDYYTERLLRKKKIAVVSHLLYPVKPSLHYKTIGWIPDFQHLHLPEMFSKSDLSLRNAYYAKLAAYSNIIILSSYSVLDDFKRFAPEFSHKARVLQFVSQPNRQIYDVSVQNSLKIKYAEFNKYFFLPNQFWKHKNHDVVFKAVKILKDRRYDIIIACSGFMEDNRNKNHVSELLEYIRENNLESNIRLLGMIDSADLFYFMRNSIAVLNPSLFEGWSTTVEEAKSMGKSVILSDIAVHREQNPPSSIYFNPREPEELADILFKKYNESNGGPDFELEKSAEEKLTKRTIQFAETYQNIILELFT